MQLLLIETVKSKLNNIPIKNGQLIKCRDTGEIYYDDSTGIRSSDCFIIPIDTEQEIGDVVAPLNNKFYLVKETGNIYTLIGSALKCVTQKSKIQKIKSSKIITTSVTSIDIGITDFDKNLSELLVFKNGLYIEEDEEYTISEDSKSIYIVNGNWEGTEEVPIKFNFIVSIIKSTI